MLSFQFLQLLLLGAEFLLAAVLIMIWSSLKSEREQYQQASKKAYKKLERFAADLEEHTNEILHDLRQWHQQTMEAELKTMQERISQEGTKAAKELHQTTSAVAAKLESELSTLPATIAQQVSADFTAQLKSAQSEYSSRIESRVEEIARTAVKQLLIDQIDKNKQHQIVQQLLASAWENGDLQPKQK